MPVSVYVAGPDVFYPNARELADEASAIAKKHGLVALIPIDNEITAETKKECSKAIFEANVKMISDAQLVVANISPFRGPSADSGTVWEIGFAHGKGKAVFAFSSDRRDYAARAAAYPDGNAIEDFDNVENLMIAECLTGDVYGSIEEAFEAAARYAAGQA